MFIVYVIKNEEDNIYIGQTENIDDRIRRHNSELPSKEKSYTSKNRRGIWALIYKEEFQTRQEAMKREKQLKSYRGREFIRNIMEKNT